MTKLTTTQNHAAELNEQQLDHAVGGGVAMPEIVTQQDDVVVHEADAIMHDRSVVMHERRGK